MSRKGNCLDNSVMENLFGLLKQEMFYGEKFDHFYQLEQAIQNYIIFYNDERIKSKLKGCLLKILGNKPLKYYTKPKYNFWGSVHLKLWMSPFYDEPRYLYLMRSIFIKYFINYASAKLLRMCFCMNRN